MAWVERWFDVIAEKHEIPGVWRRRDGGFHVRTRVRDPRTGKRREINKQLPHVTRAREAFVWLEAEAAKIREGVASSTPIDVPQFHAFAVTVFERKIALGKIRSAAGAEKWKWVIKTHLIPEFGELFCDQFTPNHARSWQAKFAAKIRAGKMSPGTGNTILAVLRQIAGEIVDTFDVKDPLRGIEGFDTRTHRTYTYEAPNAIKPDDVPRFLEEMRVRYPQHYAFVFLGITTGLRPSSLRPLRARGDSADVRWDEGKLLVRRSHTRRSEVMDGTKTGVDQVIALDPEQMSVMRWHVDRLAAENVKRAERSPELAAVMDRTELLFPSEPNGRTRGGGFRSATVLGSAFADVGTRLKLGYPVSPRAMRRTYQDLAREAKVKDIVTRAISGHATETMQRHYSTVGDAEVREGLAAVIDIATGRRRAA